MRTTLSSLRRRGYTIKRIDSENIIAVSSDKATTHTLYKLDTTSNGEVIYQSN